MTLLWYLIAVIIIAIPFLAMVFQPMSKSKPILLVFFLIFIVFMYGPMVTMGVLSLQGTSGSMTLPAKDLFSVHWYSELQADSSVMTSVRDGIGKSLDARALTSARFLRPTLATCCLRASRSLRRCRRTSAAAGTSVSFAGAGVAGLMLLANYLKVVKLEKEELQLQGAV